MLKITIGLGTANRPKMLAETLASLTKLKVPKESEVTLLLIDNAPQNPVETVYAQYQTLFPFAAQYLVEPQRGIVKMRNRILEEAIEKGSTHIAFIDDDEKIRSDWLLEMVNTLKKYDADVVSGRTLRVLPEETEEWIVESGFFNKGTRPTGIRRPTSSTCNVLFDIKLASSWHMRFDERLNFVGSSDILFFNQAHKRGAHIIWSNEAIVEETIPKSRANAEWLAQRAFRIGNAMSIRYLIQNPKPMAYLKGLSFSLGELFQSFFYRFRLKKMSHPQAQLLKVKHHLNIARGIYNGFFGKVFEEYRTHHGA